jgi:hypothetical protein
MSSQNQQLSKNKIDEKLSESQTTNLFHVKTNPNTTRISKSKTNLPYNKYEKYDIQSLSYSLNKDYSSLHSNQNNNFLQRMKFDIYKRQIREDRLNQLINQNKVKIDEEERIKTFNHLIEDANKRFEALEKMEKIKQELDEDLTTVEHKKYTQKEWNKIYNDRFKKYENEVKEKNLKRKKEQEEIKKKLLEDELKLCKTKKGNKERIEREGKRMYEEYKKRQIKLEEKRKKYEDIYNDEINNNFFWKNNNEKYTFEEDLENNNLKTEDNKLKDSLNNNEQINFIKSMNKLNNSENKNKNFKTIFNLKNSKNLNIYKNYNSKFAKNKSKLTSYNNSYNDNTQNNSINNKNKSNFVQEFFRYRNLNSPIKILSNKNNYNNNFNNIVDYKESSKIIDNFFIKNNL